MRSVLLDRLAPPVGAPKGTPAASLGVSHWGDCPAGVGGHGAACLAPGVMEAAHPGQQPMRRLVLDEITGLMTESMDATDATTPTSIAGVFRQFRSDGGSGETAKRRRQAERAKRIGLRHMGYQQTPAKGPIGAARGRRRLSFGLAMARKAGGGQAL